MTTASLFAGAVLVVLCSLLVFRAIPAIRAYFTYRGKRLITCPETHKTAAVDVAARKAAAWELVGAEKLRLDRCSRWPEREDCGQECLQQIETDPENCLVWHIVSDWYEDKRCAICRKRFSSLRHLDHVPALMGPDQVTTEWKQIRPEQLPEILSTHVPVCWNCHVTETFRRLHPELLVDRRQEHTPVGRA